MEEKRSVHFGDGETYVEGKLLGHVNLKAAFAPLQDPNVVKSFTNAVKAAGGDLQKLHDIVKSAAVLAQNTQSILITSKQLNFEQHAIVPDGYREPNFGDWDSALDGRVICPNCLLNTFLHAEVSYFHCARCYTPMMLRDQSWWVDAESSPTLEFKCIDGLHTGCLFPGQIRSLVCLTTVAEREGDGYILRGKLPTPRCPRPRKRSR